MLQNPLLSARRVQPCVAAALLSVLLLSGAHRSETASVAGLLRVAGTPVAGVGAAAGAAVGTLDAVGAVDAVGALDAVGDLVASAPPSTAAPAPAEAVITPPAARGVLPTGKGMWLWQPDKMEGGNVDALVARAKALGFTHLYARTGSTSSGLHGLAFLDQLLPRAHAANIRVYGWDFPKLIDPEADVARAVGAITHTTPGGHRIDGFVPDIETSSEGVQLSELAAHHYGQRLREAVGHDYPLVAAVPRPSAPMVARYPYGAVVKYFDAVAPMVYWLNRQPDTDVAGALVWLSQFGKPVIPIGQAYDGAPEGGRPGAPHPDEIRRFIATAEQYGATGVSFWSWQHATPEIFHAIGLAPEFNVPVDGNAVRPGQARVLQNLMRGLDEPAVPVTGRWDPPMEKYVAAYQEAANIPASGKLDGPTRQAMLQIVPPPIKPLPRR